MFISYVTNIVSQMTFTLFHHMSNSFKTTQLGLSIVKASIYHVDLALFKFTFYGTC